VYLLARLKEWDEEQVVDQSVAVGLFSFDKLNDPVQTFVDAIEDNVRGKGLQRSLISRSTCSISCREGSSLVWKVPLMRLVNLQVSFWSWSLFNRV